MESVSTCSSRCRRCFVCYKWLAEAPDTRRLKLNWFVIIITNLLAGLGDFLTASSLHQFVTEPADSSLSARPGLGLSETWYSCIVGIMSLGQLAGAIMVGILSRYMYIKYLMLAALGLTTIGGVLYGIGSYGWMILIGRFLIGLYQGAHMTIYRTYIGETSEIVISKLPREKQAKSTIKYTMIAVAFGVGTLGVATGPVLSAVLAQFPAVDQYRWPGWFTAALAVLLMVVVVCLIHEKKTDLKRASPEKRECKPRVPHLPIPLITLMWFIAAGLVPIWALTVIETLENPILSDIFGLGIKYTSYVFIFTIGCESVGLVTVLILGKLHIDNRLIYLIGALLLIAGSSILGDWQSIGGDPCNQFNNNLTLPADNVTIQLVAPFNGTPTTLTVTDCDTRCDTSLCDQLTRISDSLGPDSTVCVQLDDDEMQQLLQCVWTNMFLTLDTAAQQWETESSGAHDGTVFLVFRIISNNTLSCELSSCDSSSNHTTTSECVCQAYSSVPGYSCFWNQISRVTREHCDTCLPTCLSRTHSLYFAQFIAALIFFSPIYPIGRLSLTFIMSDCASGQSQGLVMATLIAVGAIGRATGPLWANPIYLVIGRRTWLLMMILVAMQLVVLVWFILLCKQLKHKQVSDTTTQDTVGYKVDEDAVQLLSYEQSAPTDGDEDSSDHDEENGLIENDNKTLL